MLCFADGKEGDEPLPPWARYFINVGISAVLMQEKGRRISLFSMPCDSVAAGLVCLGAVSAGLTLSHERMLESYLDGLWRHARQYLTACRKCKTRCDPKLASCGYVSEAEGLFRKANDGGSYQVTKALQTLEGKQLIELSIPKRKLTTQCNHHNAADWRIADQPQFVILGGDEVISSMPYEALLSEKMQVSPHQRFISAADVCLVARTSGASLTRDAFAHCRLVGPDATEWSLERLLRVHDWQVGSAISRTVLYNTRTRAFDRDVPVRLAVADGANAFLTALSERRLDAAHIIGVISRVAEREDLVALDARLSEIGQWYEAVDALPGFKEPSVPGIGQRLLYRGDM